MHWKESRISIYCHYLPVLGLGNLRLLPSLDVVALRWMLVKIIIMMRGYSLRFSGSLSGIEPSKDVSIVANRHGLLLNIP